MKAAVEAKAGAETHTSSEPGSADAIRDASNGLYSVASRTVGAMNEVMKVADVCVQVLRASVHLSLMARDTTLNPRALDGMAEKLHADAYQGLAAVRRCSSHARELLADVEQAHASIIAHAKGLADEAIEWQRERESFLAERATHASLAVKVAAHARVIKSVLEGVRPSKPGATG